ncbi:MAG: aromatic amino acid transport family protein [Gammaproteobacteria bacterium]
MNKKAIGSVLMILGTSIGAGMLALPVVTAHENISMSLMLLLSSWIVMTLGALSLLEVNLWLKPGTDLISMTRATLGVPGKILTWIIYLLLLYSLICAYLSGTSDILKTLLTNIDINIPQWLATLISLAIVSTIVGRGIGSVDLVNRGLLSVKLIAYLILIALTSSHLNLNWAFQGDYQWHDDAMMLMLTSFGFAIIIPSLRTYLDSDQKLLKKVVLIGSLLPLLIYTVWIIVIQSIIPRQGTGGLIDMITSPQTNSMLMQSISLVLHTSISTQITKLFISICAVTSFLGVSICLTNFVADGLNTATHTKSKLLVYAVSYLPPLLIVFISPGIFIRALSYAGILCLLLLIIIPLAMLYVGRYKLNLERNQIMPGGKKVIIGLLILGVGLLLINLF